MSSRIVFLRHGRTHFNKQKFIQGHTDVALDHVGLAQALRVAEKVRTKKIHHIYSSDLKRAAQTAQIVSQHVGIAVHSTDALRERCYGDLECHSWEEITNKIHAFQSAWNYQDAGWCAQFSIEPRSDFRTRLATFLTTVQTRHPDESVVVVSHGGAIRMMLSILRFSDAYVHALKIKNTEAIIVERRGEDYIRVSLHQLP